MTVSELIERLTDCDQTLSVYACDWLIEDIEVVTGCVVMAFDKPEETLEANRPKAECR